MHTRTGQFPIGFRRGWSDWQKTDLSALAAWTRQAGFAFLDLMNLTVAEVATVKAAGITVGSADLLDFGKLLSADVAVRKEFVAKNVAYVKELGAAGVKVFFTCMIGDATQKRADNYRVAVESFAPIAEAAAGVGASVAVEGYPGGGPTYPSIACTPETVRTILRDIPRGLSLNYDPSHLIRLGVDHVRFLNEFAPHVTHAHAKDTEIMQDAIYELGLYQGSAFKPGLPFGEHAWRYTIPGHGCARWTECFRILKSAGYAGLVSIELEDGNFNGSEAGEKLGLTSSRDYLQTV